MKKLVLFLSLIAAFPVTAQDTTAADTTWKKGGEINLNFTQTSLTNWAAGGQSSMAAVGLFNVYLKYAEGKNSWDNIVDLGYGMVKPKG